jgi:hypothetical protein
MSSRPGELLNVYGYRWHGRVRLWRAAAQMVVVWLIEQQAHLNLTVSPARAS